MEVVKTISLMMGASWASGINLYATVIVLGLSHRFEWVTLPQTLDPLATWPVIVVASILYAVEFLADKIPAVDSAWDAVHTVIRPLGGAALAFMAVGDTSTQYQIIAIMFGSALALEAHATKATTRLAVNTSPEPVSNIVVSTAEDVIVVGLVALAMTHPVLATVCILCFLVGSLYLLWKLSTFLARACRRIFRRTPLPEANAPVIM